MTPQPEPHPRHSIGGVLSARTPEFQDQLATKEGSPQIRGRLHTYGGQTHFQPIRLQLDYQHEKDLIALGPIASPEEETITDYHSGIASRSCAHATLDLFAFTQTPKGDITILFKENGLRFKEGHGVQVFFNKRHKETVLFQSSAQPIRLHYSDYLFQTAATQTLAITLRLLGEPEEDGGGFALERVEFKIKDPV